MPPFGPIKRREMIRCLKALGFQGPFPGGNHEFMVRDGLTLTLPNPHRSDVGRELLARILRQASIDRHEWERV